MSEATQDEPFGFGVTGNRETYPDKLRFLASWMDREQDNGRWEASSREVQSDLRRMADSLERVKAQRDTLRAAHRKVISLEPDESVCLHAFAICREAIANATDE